MSKFVPAGFDQAKIIDGLHKAMGFGEPNDAADKATFHFPRRAVATGTDSDGVPFDPDTPRPDEIKAPVTPTCSVTYADSVEQSETFGNIKNSRLKITLLGPDYDQVEGFEYVVMGGDRYYLEFTPPKAALGSIDVVTVWLISEDER